VLRDVILAAIHPQAMVDFSPLVRGGTSCTMGSMFKIAQRKQTPMYRTPRHPLRPAALAWIVACLCLAAAVRLHNSGTPSLWFDEGWSAYAAAQPNLWAAFNADATNPPLYYGLLHLSAQISGHSEFGLRWLSFVLGMIATAWVVRLARQAAGDAASGDAVSGDAGASAHDAAVWAAFVAALSAPLAWAAQEARMYTLLAALVGAAAWAWWMVWGPRLGFQKGAPMGPAHTHGRRTAWAVLLLCQLALMYSHNTAPIIALWLNAVSALAWLVWWRRWRMALLWVAGQAVVAALWLPYFLARFVAVQSAESAIVRQTPLDGVALLQAWGALWTAPWALTVRAEWLWLTAGAAVLVVWACWRAPVARWLCLHTLILCAGVWLGLTVLGNELHGRYWVMALPPLLAAVGVGMAQLRSMWRGMAAAGLIALWVVNAQGAADPNVGRDDARGMAAYYAQTLGARDTVLMWSYADRYDLAYYWTRQNVAAARVVLPEGADWAQVLPLLPSDAARVALNVWYTQRADFRGMLGCVLGHGTPRPPQRYDTFGMMTLVYDAPAAAPVLTLVQQAPSVPSWSVAQVTAVAAPQDSSAERAVCLPVRLAVPAPTAAELKLAVTVYNPLGWPVVQQDVILADASQRTSTEITTAAELMGFPLLRLPLGAPPGRYTVRVLLYDAAHPSGHLRTNGGGREVLLGAWQVRAGAWHAAADNLPSGDLHPLTIRDGQPDLAAPFVPQDLTARNGDGLRLTFAWGGVGPVPPLTLQSADGAWQAALTPPLDAQAQGVALDWRAVQVPPTAASGPAQVVDDQGRVLARVNITATPARYDAPTVDTPLLVQVLEAGTSNDGTTPFVQLVGTRGGAAAQRGQAFSITLVWRAQAAAAQPYTVFVQLLDADGRLIAQSDAQPPTPTTAWRAGEYIEDTHMLTFSDADYSGSATLWVGLYDADGTRLSVRGDGVIVRDNAAQIGALVVAAE
jgi:hypothetical protein